MTTTKTREVYEFIMNHAEKNTTTTYQEIALACALTAAGNQMGAVLSPILSNIFLFCHLHDLPFLTSIVVRKSGNEQGLPGVGFWKLLSYVNNSSLYFDVANGSRARKSALTDQLQTEVWSAFSGKPTMNLDYSLLDIADAEDHVLPNMVAERMGKQVNRQPSPAIVEYNETASLSHDEVEIALEQMRKKIAKEFGVTLVQDVNGVEGPAGARYLTLRFGDFTVSTTINQISSYTADVAHNASLNEDK